MPKKASSPRAADVVTFRRDADGKYVKGSYRVVKRGRELEYVRYPWEKKGQWR